jgi:GT2 family glycosyltransferase
VSQEETGSSGGADAARAGRSLLVVIVNYRTAGLVIDCLASLEPEIGSVPGLRVRVVVTDNASGDDSVERLGLAIRERAWGRWVLVCPLECNGGFSYGNNGAIGPALGTEDPPDYVWMLNPDTIVRPGALGTLVGFLETHPDAGIVGCRLTNLKGVVENSAFRFPTVLSELEGGMRFGPVSRLLSRYIQSPPAPGVASRCDWASGASLMIRRSVFDAIGLLDERYFMYFEETDFCLRARRAGWGCWYVPEAEVVHLAGQSSGVTGEGARGKRVPAYWYRARRYFFEKNLGRTRAFLANVAWSLGFLCYRMREPFRRGSERAPRGMLRDFVYYHFVEGRGGEQP